MENLQWMVNTHSQKTNITDSKQSGCAAMDALIDQDDAISAFYFAVYFVLLTR